MSHYGNFQKDFDVTVSGDPMIEGIEVSMILKEMKFDTEKKMGG